MSRQHALALGLGSMLAFCESCLFVSHIFQFHSNMHLGSNPGLLCFGSFAFLVEPQLTYNASTTDL